MTPANRHGGARPNAGRKAGGKNRPKPNAPPARVNITPRVSPRAAQIARAIGGDALTLLLEQHPGAELVDLRARRDAADARRDWIELGRIDDAIEAWDERHGVGCIVDERDDEGTARCRWCATRDGQGVCESRLRERRASS